MRSVLDRGGPSGPYVVVLSERWWCFSLCFRRRGGAKGKIYTGFIHHYLFLS